MAKQSSPKETKQRKKQIMLQLTGKSMALWMCLLFLVCGWMFVLGVLVGRGTAPVNFDIQAIQEELMALKASMLQKEKSVIDLHLEKGPARDTLDFYEVLREKTTEEQIALPVKKEAPAKAEKQPAAPQKETPRPRVVTQEKKDQPLNFSADGNLAVQVAATKDLKSAGRMVARLRKKGYSAYSVKAEIPDKGTWYRVRVGYFDSKADAEKARQQLIKDQFAGIIVRK